MAILAEEGHRIVEAYDSGHVLQLIMRPGIDVVILPDDMEPMDGEELLPVIRRLTLATIVVVGEGEETTMASALFRGADAYLHYPDEPGRLRSRIRALLRPRRVRRQAGGGEEGGSRANEPGPFAYRFFRAALVAAV